ncbi:MAG: NAD(P)H-binding protein [Arthrobacter sp.]|nr:NAD(P)H-binding protein [Arthrobacter sp.]
MKIGIIGATGNAGRAVVAQALARGHDVTAIVRNPGKAAEMLGADLPVLNRDAFDLTTEDLRTFDVVVNAFATAPEQASRHVDLARKLVELTRGNQSPRLVFILGAGSLKTGADHHLFIEDLRQLPSAEAWVSIPENQLRELEYLRSVADVDWVGVSPSAQFEPGEARDVALGIDELLITGDGTSHTTTGTMAVAILDEIEQPAHRRQRFTVGDR